MNVSEELNFSYSNTSLFNPTTNKTDSLSVSSESNISGEEWTNQQIILFIILGLITIITISSNSLILYLFYKSKKVLRSPTHFFLANLAVADLLVGVIVMPVLLSITVFNFKWYWGTFICTIFDYTHFTFCATSMLSTIGVGIERFIGIKFPLKHRTIMNKKRVMGMIILIWVFAFVMTAAPLTIWPVEENYLDYVCYVNLRQDFVLFITFGVYFAPVLSTVVLYLIIYRTAIEPFSAKTTSSITKPNSSGTISFRNTKIKNQEHEKLLKARIKETNLAKKVTLIVCVMFIMFGPLFLMFLFKGIKSPYFSLERMVMAAWLRYANSMVNPFIYALAVPGYKKEFKRIFLNEQKHHRNDTERDSFTSTSFTVHDDGNYSTSPSTADNYSKSDIDSRSDYLSTSHIPTVENLMINNVCKVPLNQSLGVMNIKPCFCTYCGDKLHSTLNNQADIYSCTKCLEKYSEMQTLVLSKPKLSLPTLSVVKKEVSALGRNSVSEKFYSSSSIISPELLTELESFLKVVNPKNPQIDCADVVRNRGTKLITNLQTFSGGNFKMPKEGVVEARPKKHLNYNAERIKEIRSSVMVPIIEKRSELINENKNPTEVDWSIIKELDEIISKLESTIIEPLIRVSEQIETNK